MSRWSCARVSRVIATVAVCLTLLTGCEEETKLKKEELQSIDALIKTGVSFEDPYVRTETLRVLELIDDPSLSAFAVKAAADPSDMVAIQALSVLNAANSEEFKRLMFTRWNRSKPEARRALFELVMDKAPKAIQQELAIKALRTPLDSLHERAFEVGMVAPIKAAADSKDPNLERVLLPELGKFITHKSPRIAGRALQIVTSFGTQERADAFVQVLQDPAAAPEARLRAARVLRYAHIESARDAYKAIVARHDKPVSSRLKLPPKPVDPELLRASILGLAALEEPGVLTRAQAYLNEDGYARVIETLEALASNTSPEVTINLKVAMQDARTRVRHRAIALYGKRPDAQARALMDALRGDDLMAKRAIARILIARFSEEWARELKFQFQADEFEATLKLLRDVITDASDASVVGPSEEVLLKIIEKGGEPAATAAYLLLLNQPNNSAYLKPLVSSRDMRTQYVFLEHLVRHQPKGSVRVFRRYINGDLYAMRLLSAAGLLKALPKPDKDPAQAPSTDKP